MIPLSCIAKTIQLCQDYKKSLPLSLRDAVSQDRNPNLLIMEWALYLVTQLFEDFFYQQNEDSK